MSAQTHTPTYIHSTRPVAGMCYVCLLVCLCVCLQVIVLQSHVRRWLAERYVAALHSDRVEHRRWETEQEMQRRKEREERIRHEFERRLNPRSKEDFEVLYHALESESFSGPVCAVGVIPSPEMGTCCTLLWP